MQHNQQVPEEVLRWQAAHLREHQGDKYEPPTESELDNLTEDDLIMVAFINKVDVWWVLHAISAAP